MPVNIGVNIQRSPNRINQQLREAGVEGKFPKLLLDFKDQYYLASGGSKTLANAVTHARSGNAVMTDGYGPELVVNGDFASNDLTGFTDNSTGTGSVAVVNNQLQLTGAGASNRGFVTSDSFSTKVGTAYIIEFNFLERGGSSRLQLKFQDSVGIRLDEFPIGSTGRKSFVAIAQKESSFIAINNYDTGTATIDNVSVREMPVLKWAPHNLCRNSEDATASNFFKSNVTVTSVSSVTAPNGTTGVNKYEFAGAAGDNVYITDGGADIRGGVTGTFAVFAKAVSSATTIRMRIWDNGSTGAQYVDKSVSADDWTLLTHEATTSSNSNTANFAIYNNSSGNASDIYVWGFHIFRSDLGGMVDNPERGDSYVPTTSSAAYLPRIGHHVYNGSAWANEGLLAESEARTNLFHYSHDFSDSYWGKAHLTVTADQGIAPDGTNTAFKLIESSTSNIARHVTRGGGTLANSTQYTAAVYLKKGTRTKAKINVFTGAASHTGKYDIENGTVYSSAGADAATIEDVGNGWFRCSITTTTSASGTANVAFGMLPDSYDVVYDGDGSSYIYAWGATLEASPTRSSYIPTTGAATVTRAAETFTIPSANLPWPSPQYIGSERLTGSWIVPTGYDNTVSGTGTSVSVTGGTTQSRTYLAIDGVDTGEVYQVDITVNSVSSGAVTCYIRDGATGVGTILLIGHNLGAGDSFVGHIAAASNDMSVLLVGSSGADFDATVSVREINPLSVSIAMDGAVTYADNDDFNEVYFYLWDADSDNFIRSRIRTDSTKTGQFQALQEESAIQDGSATSGTYFSPDILVPYNIVSRHGSTFIQGAEGGVVLTENTTPTALPDLSATDLDLAYNYMGTIGTFRVWDRDITDAGLVEATNPSLEPSLSLTFEGTGTNSFVVNDWAE